MAYTAAEIRTMVRQLLHETTASFFSDTEIDDWVEQGTLDISTVAKCVEAVHPFALAANVDTYALPTASVEAVHVQQLAPQRRGLRKITPSMAGDQSMEASADEPLRWYEWGGAVYVEPIPNLDAAGKNMAMLYARSTHSVLDLPDSYQVLAIHYGVYRGKVKDRRMSEAATLFAEYANALAVRKLDLQQRTPHSDADLKAPQQTREVRG